MQSLWDQQVINILNWQVEKLVEMDNRLKQLQEDIEELKGRSETKIDRIEYKFDQLKIEKLDGTLNIGLTPNIGKTIEDFTVNGQSVEQVDQDQQDKRNPSQSGLFTQIQHEVSQFLADEVPQELEQLKQSYQIVLGQQYTEVMIEDIRKQIDERIRFYIGPEHQERSNEEIYNLQLSIVQQVKQDIRVAIRQHIEQINPKEA
ncbi:spore germination protein GerPC [Paenibacillus sp. N1-5-1-14]|uniref:spore germination protein GerPC n=1 Tax=Paenibacillus radicibacter TaxID=2972488 RepID=UPI00215914D7|nr:spore germination protein GerPC [Paenibacillus radicibacter]MCR8641201.1 spore germination protein GerPC [Paenibacillus radicibacter]